MSTAQEIGRLIVRLMGDGTDYMQTLEKAQKETAAFVQDAQGRFRDLQGRFVAVNEVLRSQVASTMQRLNALGQSMEDWASYGQQIGGVLKSTGRMMAINLTAPLTFVSGYALKAAIDFETSFAGVRKTIDATEEEFATMSREIRDLSLRVPVDVNELNAIAESAGQLGIEKGNIVKFTETIAAMGEASNLSTEEAATGFAQFLTLTGSNQDTVENLGSSIVALGAKYAATEKDIMNFSLRIAGAGSLVGLTDAEITGMSAALAQVGLEAEAGGTAIQKMLLGITSEVNTNGELLSAFAATAGMSADQFKQAWQYDAAGAFSSFIEGLGSQGQEAIGILKELGVEDERSIRTFLSLAGAGDVLRDALEMSTKAYKENLALVKEAEQRYKTTASQLQMLWNAVKDVAIELGTELLPMLRTVVGWFKDNVVPILMSAVQWFNNLSPAAQGWIMALTAIAAMAGPAIYFLESMISNMSSNVGLLGMMIKSTRTLAMTIGLLNIASGGWLYVLGGIAGGVAALAVAFGFLADSSSEAGGNVEKTMTTMEKMQKEQRDAASRQMRVQKALEEARRHQAATEQVNRAFKAADDSISGLIGSLEKENALFGLSGHERDIASLEYDLKQKNMSGSLSAEDKAELEELAGVLKLKEQIAKVDQETAKARKQAQDEHDRNLESMAEQARQYLHDQLTPIEKLKAEFKGIWKLVDVGALTAGQAQAIMQGKVSAMAAQITTGETLRTAGGGVYANSREAMIAQREGTTTSQKSVEDGIWEQVNKTEVIIETSDQILRAIKERKAKLRQVMQVASF